MNFGAGAERVVVLDFETSGMSPERGDRAIEIGAVRICNGLIVDRFQSLMNSGIRVGDFIEAYTGITNEMLSRAPDAGTVMMAFRDFIGDCPLVAHNASFDRRFLSAELAEIGQGGNHEFACSMLVARRVYPEAPNHKLETLVRYKDLPMGETFHRALADAEMTAHLWMGMEEDIRSACGLAQVPFEVMQALGTVKIRKVSDFLRQLTDGAE